MYLVKTLTCCFTSWQNCAFLASTLYEVSFLLLYPVLASQSKEAETSDEAIDVYFDTYRIRICPVLVRTMPYSESG